LIGGRFEIEALAGSGAMGSVHRAIDRESGQRVALKTLHRSDVSTVVRFDREAAVLARLAHPAIVRYVAHGVDEGNGAQYLAMEWLEGETLAQRLTRGPLGLEESVSVTKRVAEAIGVAHAEGIIHRDLKPANLMLEASDASRAKVLDFGVAHLRGESLTQTGLMIGTPGYMSPEQARGERDITAAADVFALGCILFRCLTGRAAFEASDGLAVLLKVLLEQPQRPRELRAEIPRSIETLVLRMMAKAAGDRPPDGMAVARELTALEHELPVSKSRSEPPSLTRFEQRVLCLVVVDRPLLVLDLETIPQGPTAPSDADRETTEESLIHEIRSRPDSMIHRLVDGSLVAIFSATGNPRDKAALAARHALSIKARTHRRVALATGFGIMTGAGPVGDVIERATRLLRASGETAADAVLIDDVTSGLLEGRFAVLAKQGSLELTGDYPVESVVRKLAGKVTSCVGRERELGLLIATVEESRDDNAARAVLVTGPSGIGKSRVEHELLRRLESRAPDLRAWVVRGEALSAGSPFFLVASLIRVAAGIREGEPLARQRAKLIERVGLRVAKERRARVAEFFGEIIGTPVADEPSLELAAARKDLQLLGDQMLGAWLDFIESECRSAPLLVLIDDLHWGDRPSMRLLDATLRLLRDAPFTIVGLGRPELHDAFPKLWSERGVLEIKLAELPRGACDRLAREVLGPAADPALVRDIVDRAGGHPFFLEELIRAACEGQSGVSSVSVQAVVLGRFDSLPEDARHVLRAGAIFGQSFWAGGVRALLGDQMPEERVRASLALLEDREILVRRTESRLVEAEYEIRQDLVRDAAMAMLTDADRTLGHRLAADWLEAMGEHDALVLAEHCEHGAERGRAATHLRRAAEEAFAGNDLAAVLAHATRGIACAGQVGDAGKPILCALSGLLAFAHRMRGELRPAEQRANEAIALAEPGTGIYFTAAGELAVLAGRTVSAERIERVVGLFDADPSPDASREFVQAAVRTTHAMLNVGRYDLVPVFLRRIDQALGVGGADASTLARIAHLRGVLCLHEGDLERDAEFTRAAVTKFEEAGDVRGACSARSSLGYALVELGSYVEGESILRRVIAEGERFGFGNLVAGALHNLGLALANSGKVDEGRRLELRSVDEARAQGNERLEGSSRAYHALIAVASGDLDVALADARAARRILSNNTPLLPFATAVLAHVLLALSHPAEALESAREGALCMRELGRVETGESLVRVTLAEALWASGARDEAREVILDARARLVARAERIARLDWQHTFLEAVPENARTLRLANAWATAFPNVS
jgi:serine/threonine protein kinase